MEIRLYTDWHRHVCEYATDLKSQPEQIRQLVASEPIDYDQLVRFARNVKTIVRELKKMRAIARRTIGTNSYYDDELRYIISIVDEALKGQTS